MTYGPLRRLACILALALLSTSCVSSQGGRWQERLALSGRVEFVAEFRRFDPAGHSLVYCQGGHLCLVDGYPVFGTEGSVPKVEVVSLTVVVDGRPVPLEHKGMYNPWSPVEGRTLAVDLVEGTPDEFRVRGEFSDGAAAYVAEWSVAGHGSARVLLDCVECLQESCTKRFGPVAR